MDNKISMTCHDIKKRLQPFLDDLLAEEEYKAFRDHITTCDKCEEYVRSIGSLSNQLWKLGKVRVPEDLTSTAIYKLTHPEQKTRASKFVISKKQIIAGSILILSAAALFLGISYFKGKRTLQDTDDAPTIKIEVIYESKPPTDSEAKALLKQLEAIAEKVGVTEKDRAVEEDATKEDFVEVKETSEGEALIKTTDEDIIP